MTIVYDSTRVFGIFFLFTCVVVFGTTFNNITSAWIEAKEEAESIRKLQSLSSEKFTRAWVERVMGDRADSYEEGVRMDGESSASGKQHGKGCTKERFILMVLLEMNVISMKDDVKPLVKVRENPRCYCSSLSIRQLKIIIYYILLMFGRSLRLWTLKGLASSGER